MTPNRGRKVGAYKLLWEGLHSYIVPSPTPTTAYRLAQTASPNPGYPSHALSISIIFVLLLPGEADAGVATTLGPIAAATGEDLPFSQRQHPLALEQQQHPGLRAPVHAPGRIV